jgi:hypothetical protein
MADNKNNTRHPVREDTAPIPPYSRKSIAGSLAVMFLKEAIRSGRQIEIPSLGIKTSEDDLLNRESA